MTIWWGVDAAGFVGLFDTRGHGRVPERALLARELDELALDALRFARSLAVSRTTVTSSETVTGRVLVVVDESRAPALGTYRDGAPRSHVEDLLGPSAWVVREAAPRVLATLEPLSKSQHEALGGDRTVVATIDETDVRAWLERAGDSGLYRWRCPGESSDAYVRDAGPNDPIRSRELPSELRRAIERTRARVTFGTTRGVSLARSIDPKPSGRSKQRGPRLSREDREWDALVARTRRRGLSDTARAIGYLVIAVLAGLLVFIAGSALLSGP